MKRRTILLAPAAAAAAATQSANANGSASSLYGTPGSASAAMAERRLAAPRMAISMSRIGIPAQAINPALKLIEVAETLFSSTRARQAFLNNPGEYLARAGVTFPDGVTAESSADARVLRALLSDRATAALSSGSIEAYMQALEQEALIAPSSGMSNLSTVIAQALNEDHSKLAPTVRALIQSAGTGPVVIPDAELQAVGELLKEAEINICSGFIGICVGWIYIVALSNIAVLANLLLAVNAIQSTNVRGGCMGCHIPRAPGGFGQLAARAEPDELKRYELAIRVARLRGQHAKVGDLVQALFGAEVRAVVNGIQQSGRFDLSGHRRMQLEQAMLAFVGKFMAANADQPA